MKTIKILCSSLAVLFLLVSCSNDDNSPAEMSPTVQEMLSSGVWLWQSSSMQTVTSCNMQSYFNFIDDDTLLVENFDEDEMDNCVSDGIQSVPYTLLNDDEFEIEFEGELFVYTIDFIDETRLVVSIELDSGKLTNTFMLQS